MTKLVTRISLGIGEFLFLSVLTLVAPLLVAIDVAVIGHGVSEISLTETTQEALLLTSALLFGYGAWRQRNSRGFLVLVAGFFSCMLVRELDGFLDHVWHGFWVWPASLVSIASICYAMVFCRNTVLKPMSAFMDTKAYFHIMLGLIVVLVFSRIFGSGTLLLKHLEGGSHLFKSALQEGLELFGYVFIAYGSFLFTWRNKTESVITVQSKQETPSIYRGSIRPRFSHGSYRSTGT